MKIESNIEFNFFTEISEGKTYNQLFPKREVGLAVIYLYENIISDDLYNRQFTEREIHQAFKDVFNHNLREQTEDYSQYIYELQEYFLDYNQEIQKYIFKDYAYKFCEHAKNTLKGAFNPTKIKTLCSDIIELLKTADDVQMWFENHFVSFKPKLGEQIDFLEKQIAKSIAQIKKDTDFSEKSFIDILKSVEKSLDKARKQNRELRSAYEHTKKIRTLIDQREDLSTIDLVSDVNSFISYTNSRLNTIDKKLERIQPRIRQLFNTLNRPRFNSKIQKFTRYLLDKSELISAKQGKEIVFPNNLKSIQIYMDTPNFTILRKDVDLFPSKPRKINSYKENKEVVNKNKQKIKKRLFQQKKIIDWENYILSKIDLGQQVILSEIFFEIMIQENDIEIAMNVYFNVIRKLRKNTKISIHLDNKLEENNHFKNVTLWKTEVQKLR